MTYNDEVDTTVQILDIKLDEIEDIVSGLPIRPGQKRVIQQMIYQLYSEIEGAIELSASDYE